MDAKGKYEKAVKRGTKEARDALNEKIESVGRDNLLYCDTDSIVLEKKLRHGWHEEDEPASKPMQDGRASVGYVVESDLVDDQTRVVLVKEARYMPYKRIIFAGHWYQDNILDHFGEQVDRVIWRPGENQVTIHIKGEADVW